MRTLRISDKFDGFYYDYCIKRKLFSKKCKTWKTEFYDFKDPSVRLRLKDMGFKLRVLKDL